LAVSCPLPDQDASIYSDSSRVRQVFINLINNAFKYTKQGAITFGYSIPEEGIIKFFVRDTGVGIPENNRTAIFERFRQGDVHESRILGGTGLGLTISDGLIKLLGGDIWVESTPKVGSVFYFTLPFDIAPTEGVSIIHREQKNQDVDWSSSTILVVEDDDINFEYIRTILARTKAKTVRAGDGEEVLELFNKGFMPDLVLMDIRLPKLNGLETTQALRARGVKIPIVAQTAYAMSDDREKCIVAGCDAYLSKPIIKKTFTETLGRFLSNNL
jgi:CheY-like chemotaxis protein